MDRVARVVRADHRQQVREEAAEDDDGDAGEAEQPFVYLKPAPGTVLMWESWLRHEVPANRAAEQRISISFNYA